MVTSLLMFFAPVDYTAAVAVRAAYVLHTHQEDAPSECCGRCTGGVITHGDGHKTPCPCPPDCKCKSRSQCKDGTCPAKPAK